MECRSAEGFDSRNSFNSFWAEVTALGVRPETRSRSQGRLPLSSSLGGASSRITQALVPPTPKAFTRALSGVPFTRSHSLSCVLTKKGLLGKSILGFGSLKWRLAGNLRCFRQRAVLIRLAAPEAMSVCPMLLFTEPMAQYCFKSVCCRKVSDSEATSMGSPMGVAVPCAST